MYRQSSVKRDRSFDSVLNKIWRIRSENHEGFKNALYNFLIAAAIGAFVIVCIILRPFVRPLLWSFLMGAVLFPFKRKLASLLNDWFENLEINDRNVFIAITIAPLQCTEYCGSLWVNWIKKHWKILTAGLLTAICCKLLLLYAPRNIFCWAWKMILFSHSIFAMLMNLLNFYILVAILAIYLTSVYFFWNQKNAHIFLLIGQSFWMILLGYACSFLGALQVPAFLISILYLGVAIFLYVKKQTTDDDDINMFQRFAKLLDQKQFTEAVNKVYDVKQDIEKDETLTDSFENIDENKNDNEELLSDFYFKLLFYACLATFLYRNVWMLILAAIPISIHLFYTIGSVMGFWDFIFQKIYNFYSIVKIWTLDHHTAILPLCLPGFLELNYKIQIFIRSSLKSSVDLVTSILMIVLMILIAMFVSIFFCVNIYSETIEVAYVVKDVINKTITDRPELIDILPENIQSSIDDALDNAHHYGRRRIEQYIDDLLKDSDPEHGGKLKYQILQVWDRIIQYWIDFNKSSDSIGPRVPTDAIKTTFGEIVDNPGYFKELVLVAKQGILGWAKSNTNTILEVAESVWIIIRTNISIIMSFTGEIFSLVLSGGQAFIEFLLDMIVFFTALFYLLSSSGKKYAPLQVSNYIGMSSGTKIAEALENSISGVLIALFKSAVFQGLFTWLVHTILGARIVFLPSAAAAFFSAAPFLGSYWSALPAFFELWLVQDRFYSGLLIFLLLFFIPPYMEQEIHAEMKGGGHPYLTGLAIAGGMYWLGWQGAIFGPLMLCFFIGIFEVASVALKSDDVNSVSYSEEDPKANRRHSSFDQEM